MTTPGHGGRRSALQRIQASTGLALPPGARQLAQVAASTLQKALPNPEECGSAEWRGVVTLARELAEQRLDALGGLVTPPVLAQVCTASLAQAAERYFWGDVADRASQAANDDQLAAATAHAMKFGAHARKADLAALEIIERQRSDTRVVHEALTERLHSGVAGTVEAEGEALEAEGVH